MKFIFKYLLTGLIAIACSAPQQLPGQVVSLNFQVFYDGLSPYGFWIDHPNYGYVWVPDVGPAFTPYVSAGHWVMTSYGWTWVSNYSWGWAPFHYGRWWYDSFFGWLWVPDTIWGPAWVVWRAGPGYYGWAPLGPNISITYVMSGGYIPPLDYWCFLSAQYMGRSDINYYYGPRKNTQQFINTSTIVNNTYVDNSTHTTYIAGPKQNDVEKASGRSIKIVPIKEYSEPGQTLENNELKIYRPVVSKEASVNIKPSKVTDKKEIHPIAERKTTEQEKNAEIENKKTEPLQQKNIQQTEKQHIIKPEPEKVNPRPMTKDKVLVPKEAVKPIAPPVRQPPPAKIEKPVPVRPAVPPQPKQEVPKRPRE